VTGLIAGSEDTATTTALAGPPIEHVSRE